MALPGQRTLTKAQIAKLDAKRQVLDEINEEIGGIYFRLSTKNRFDKSLYTITEMLNVINVLLADIVINATKEK